MKKTSIIKRGFPLLFLLLLLDPASVLSQEAGSCAEKLQAAQSLFEKGQVEQVPALLTDCLKSGFNREQSPEAFKLLIQSYLFEEKLAQADSAMLAFLKKNPEYRISPTDHSSFVSLFNNFESKVIIQFALHFGSNLPFLLITQSNSLSSNPGEKKYNTDAINLFLSFEAKYRLTTRLELNAEIGYSQLSFHNYEDFNGIQNSIIGKPDYTEFQKRLEIPVTLTYDLVTFGRFTPYVRAGFGPALTLSASAQVSYEQTAGKTVDLTGKDIDLGNSRILLDFFGQAGCGVKLKTREGFIFGELRSNLGLLNQLTSEGYNSGDELSWFYHSGTDRFRLNALNFNLGYTRIFYKPIRRKE